MFIHLGVPRHHRVTFYQMPTQYIRFSYIILIYCYLFHFSLQKYRMTFRLCFENATIRDILFYKIKILSLEFVCSAISQVSQCPIVIPLPRDNRLHIGCSLRVHYGYVGIDVCIYICRSIIYYIIVNRPLLQTKKKNVMQTR